MAGYRTVQRPTIVLARAETSCRPIPSALADELLHEACSGGAGTWALVFGEKPSRLATWLCGDGGEPQPLRIDSCGAPKVGVVVIDAFECAVAECLAGWAREMLRRRGRVIVVCDAPDAVGAMRALSSRGLEPKRLVLASEELERAPTVAMIVARVAKPGGLDVHWRAGESKS